MGQTLITAFFSVITLTAASRGPSESVSDNVGGCRSHVADMEAEACGGEPGIVLVRHGVLWWMAPSVP